MDKNENSSPSNAYKLWILNNSFHKSLPFPSVHTNTAKRLETLRLVVSRRQVDHQMTAWRDDLKNITGSYNLPR